MADVPLVHEARSDTAPANGGLAFVGGRTCTTCGVTHPATTEHFYRQKRGDGYELAYACKPCARVARAEYRLRVAQDRIQPKTQAKPGDTRTCTKCREIFPATEEFFYTHKWCKYGLTPRCKTCVNEDNHETFKRRMAAEPEKVRAQVAARVRRLYRKDIDKSRQYQRQYAAMARKNPEKRARLNMRKRAGGAGMTPTEFDALFASQGHRCAICKTTEPGGRSGSTGWNIDHCHKTRMVRFVLCCHCNRGLGAFRDDPALMRRAADLLEAIHDSQPASPTEGGTDPGNGHGKEDQQRHLLGAN